MGEHCATHQNEGTSWAMQETLDGSNAPLQLSDPAHEAGTSTSLVIRETLSTNLPTNPLRATACDRHHWQHPRAGGSQQGQCATRQSEGTSWAMRFEAPEDDGAEHHDWETWDDSYSDDGDVYGRVLASICHSGRVTVIANSRKDGRR